MTTPRPQTLPEQARQRRRRLTVAPAADTGPYDQAEQRRRRRVRMSASYPADFSLLREITDQAEPLAERARGLVTRSVLAAIGDLSEAVHAAAAGLGDIVEGLADRGRVAHLPPEQQARARKLLRDARAVPEHPQIAAGDVHSGRWAVTLAELAAPVSEPLSAVLGKAAATPSGQPVLLEILERHLIDIDRAALALERALDRAAAARAEQAAAPRPRTRAEIARDELRAMGVEL